LAERKLATLVLCLVFPAFAGACGGGADDGAPPAHTERVKGTNIVRVVMTASAVRRIGVRTMPVARDGAAAGHTLIPAEAVLYDPDGATWAYTRPKLDVFQRVDIDVAGIDGRSAVLVRGPPVGTAVVTVGATEIWGVEYGGIEED
jgi:hypothetical protein